MEWDEIDANGGAQKECNSAGCETIERIIRHRAGYPGATGASTTCYNVEDKGDPNVKIAEGFSMIVFQ